MGSIYETIVIKGAFNKYGNLINEEVKITRVEYLRLYSAIARKESDEEMQAFFTAFRI